jgi:hypothetical protein
MSLQENRRHCHRTLGYLLTLALALGLPLCIPKALGQSSVVGPKSPVQPKPVIPGPVLSIQQLRSRKIWRDSLVTVRKPQKGCFKARYPNTVWQAVPCAGPSKFHYSPGRSSRSYMVGGGDHGDFSASSTSLISSAEGSFDSVSSGSTEAGPNGSAPEQVSNAYSLQLNTNTFRNIALCAGASSPSCVAWEQFVFENDGHSGGALIQYWLIDYNNPCPKNWAASVNASGNDCFKNNDSGITPIPAVPISGLAQVRVIGSISSSTDNVIVAIGDDAYLTVGNNSVNAAQGWQVAEFNIFGNGDDGTASFGPNTTIAVRTAVNGTGGSITPPACQQASFTGETNNLQLSGTPAVIADSVSPAVVFSETNAAVTPAGCAATPGTGGAQMLISGDKYVDFGSDTAGLNHYTVNGAMCVVHSPGCPTNAFLGIGGVGHDGKDHFFPAAASLPAGATVDGVLYTVFWPPGMDHTDRGGWFSKGSYGADADQLLQKNAPLFTVHWQNACQSSTSADWSALPLTYQVSFLITVPKGVEVSGAQPLSTPTGDICHVSDRPRANSGTPSPTTSNFVAPLRSLASANGGPLAWSTIFPQFGLTATSTPISTWIVKSIANINNFDVFLVAPNSTSDQCYQSGHGQRLKANDVLTNVPSLYGTSTPPLALIACTYTGSTVPPEVFLTITYLH